MSQAVWEIRIELGPGLDLIQESPARSRESHQEHNLVIKALAAAAATAVRQAMHRHVVATEREIRRAGRAGRAR